MKHKIAIFGGGRVGTAMSLEMPNVPIVRRGEDCECEIACICWPAQAVVDFATSCPLGSKAYKVAFCNGPWAIEDGADHAAICYVHAVTVGTGARPKDKSWRVGHKYTAEKLAAAGLGVVCSRDDHRKFIWSKCLYLLPIVIACADTDMTTREVIGTTEHMEWYDIIRQEAVADIGEQATSKCEPRVRFLWERSPARRLLAWLPEEVAYFREKLCADL